MSLTNPYPHQNVYPGDDTAVEDVHRMRLDAMQKMDPQAAAHLHFLRQAQMEHLQRSIPPVYLTPPPPEPSTGIRPAARPRPRNWPWLFAILSPIILPLILVYTLGKHIREWGEFIEDWFHEVTA